MLNSLHDINFLGEANNCCEMQRPELLQNEFDVIIIFIDIFQMRFSNFPTESGQFPSTLVLLTNTHEENVSCN